jgi:hypothetical protein
LDLVFLIGGNDTQQPEEGIDPEVDGLVEDKSTWMPRKEGSAEVIKPFDKFETHVPGYVPSVAMVHSP